MARVISISDGTYKALSSLKGKDSFSVVIQKLLVGRSNKEQVLAFFGKGGIDEEKVKELDKEWKRWSKKYV